MVKFILQCLASLQTIHFNSALILSSPGIRLVSFPGSGVGMGSWERVWHKIRRKLSNVANFALYVTSKGNIQHLMMSFLAGKVSCFKSKHTCWHTSQPLWSPTEGEVFGTVSQRVEKAHRSTSIPHILLHEEHLRRDNLTVPLDLSLLLLLILCVLCWKTWSHVNILWFLPQVEEKVLTLAQKIICQHFNWMLQPPSGWRWSWSIQSKHRQVIFQAQVGNRQPSLHLYRSQLRSHWNFSTHCIGKQD